MAILGWQHLDTPTEWTDVVYAQMAQAAIIKARHPSLPVFVYCGYGFAFGLPPFRFSTKAQYRSILTIGPLPTHACQSAFYPTARIEASTGGRSP